MEKLLCLIWIAKCMDPELIPEGISGGFIRFYELLSLVGIIIAGFQFMDAKILRRYIFIRFKNAFILSIGLSAWCLIISRLVLIIPWKPLALIGYPYFWELLSIVAIFWVITFLLLFSIYYNTRLWIVKYRSENNAEYINSIGYHSIVEEPSEEAYRAFCRILHVNLEEIVRVLCRYDAQKFYFESEELRNLDGKCSDETIRSSAYGKACSWTKREQAITMAAIRLIEDILPDPAFCSYLASKEYWLLLKIFNYAENKKLWKACGRSFIRVLSANLIGNANSIADKEMNLGGLYSRKQLILQIVKSPGLLEHYQIVDSHYEVTRNNIKLLIFLGEHILSEYFSSITPQHSRQYKFQMKNLLKKIIDPWQTKGGQVELTSDIGGFIATIPHILTRGWIYVPEWKEKTMVFTLEESMAEKNTIISDITEMLFWRFEKILQNPEERWYSDSQIFWWIIWSDDTYEHWNNEAIISIRKKFIVLIKDRLRKEEAWQWRNWSLLKLLLTIFGWKLNQWEFTKENQIIPEWVEKSFNSEWAERLINDEKSRQENLPMGMQVQDGKIIYVAHGSNVIYPPAKL